MFAVFSELGAGEVVLAGAEHGVDDVAAAAGEADGGGVVTFALGANSGVDSVGAQVGQRAVLERR